MMLKKYISFLRNWIKNNPKEFWILVVILLAASFLRFYKLDQYMTFLGDEGRDVIVVRRLLAYADPILIGPGTSIGGMYLGPLYYYMMAPALFVAGFSPIGPALQIAILGVFTVAFVWFVVREWFPSKGVNLIAIVASSLYAVSPTVIQFSQSSWNPNIMPFFSLLCIYSIWRIWSEKNANILKWFVVLGVSSAFVLQSHYLGLLLMPTIALFWILTWQKIKSDKLANKRFIKSSFVSALVFAALMSPLLLFDIRHDWMNLRAVHKFFTVRQETVSARPWSSLPKIPEIFRQINTSLVGGKNPVAGGVVSGILFTTILYGIVVFGKKLNKTKPQILLLVSWFGFGLIGFGLYKQQIYDHYYGFVFAIPYILMGVVVNSLIKKGKMYSLLGLTLLIYLLVTNIMGSHLRFSPNNQLKRSQNVANKILIESKASPFNLAVLAERNYEDGYRYFLELNGATVLHADRWDQKTIVDQLFVVCELPKEKCDPTHSPKAEVANFGMTKIDMQWEVDGVIIYKLSHTN